MPSTINYERLYNELRAETESVLETLGAMNVGMDAADEVKILIDAHDSLIADVTATNMALTQSTVSILSYDGQHRSSLRHDYGCKCNRWSNAPQFSRAVTEQEWNSHAHIKQMPNLMENGAPTFVTPFSEDAPSDHIVFFLHMLDGNVYIVNTEGYDYCRYIAQVNHIF